ncbi:hypothetical protein [Niabella aurantiaca]|uniref:hypothetical protein n=1 Tax=Niabella aurantiaca TaxID=379900 RepID=UPI0003A485E0|nr:hypothetical protein [Niabella aurantiaca]
MVQKRTRNTLIASLPFIVAASPQIARGTGYRVTQLLKDGTTGDVVLGYDGTVVPFSAWSGPFTAISSLTPVFDYLPGNIAKTEQRALWAYQQARLNGMSVEAAWKSFGNPNFNSSRFEALYQVENDYRNFSGAMAGGLVTAPLLLPAVPAIASATGAIGNIALNAARTYGPQILNHFARTWKLRASVAGIDLANQLVYAIPQSQANGDGVGKYINFVSPLSKFILPSNIFLSNLIGQGLNTNLNGEYRGFFSDVSTFEVIRNIGLGIEGDYFGKYLGNKFSPIGYFTGGLAGDFLGGNASNLTQLMWDNFYNYYYFQPVNH